MDSIRLLQNLSRLSSKSLKLESSESTDQTLLKKAQEAVSQENKLAAVDYSVLSGSQLSETGSFTFDWMSNEDGSGTLEISYKGTTTASSGSEHSKISSNFSLLLSIGADGSVTLPQEITADQQQIRGEDFTYSNTGVLQLQNDLAERMGTDSSAQVDLSDKLDDNALAMLKRLSLIDQNGKATQLLQFLSEFAGLDRFKAGQQVSGGAETSYGMSEKALRLQSQMLQSLKMLAALGSTSGTDSVADTSSIAAAGSTTAVPETAVAVGTAAAVRTEPSATSTAAAGELSNDSASTAGGEQTPATGAAAAETAQQPAKPGGPGGPPGGAAPAAASSSTATATLDALIQTLEAAQQQKEQQAQEASRAASQAAIATVRARQGGKSDANVQQVIQEASRAMQDASQAQQAANLARLAVQNAKLQQQLASQD